MSRRVYNNAENVFDKKRSNFLAFMFGFFAFILIVVGSVFIFFAGKAYSEEKNADESWDSIRQQADSEFYAGNNDESLIYSSDNGSANEYMYSSGGNMSVGISNISSNEVSMENDMSVSQSNGFDPMVRHFNWDVLHNVNKDVIAWVYVPGTQVDYPVLQEPVFNMSYYLTHNIYKDYQKSGSIFTPNVGETGEDAHMLLYGHHMKNGTMFGDLTKYKEKEFYDHNKYVYMYYPDRTEKWQIWITEHVDSEDPVYIVPYCTGDDGYGDMLSSLQNNALYATDVSGVDKDTNVLVMTTCDNVDGSGRGRFIVGCILMESRDPSTESYVFPAQDSDLDVLVDDSDYSDYDLDPMEDVNVDYDDFVNDTVDESENVVTD